MDRGWYWRLGLVIGVTLLTLWLLIPSYYSLFVLDRADRNNLALLEETLPTADGWVFVMCLTEKFWNALLDVIGGGWRSVCSTTQ